MEHFAEPFDGVAEDQMQGLWTSWNNYFNLAVGVPGMTGNCIRIGTTFATIQQTLTAAPRWVVSCRMKTDTLKENNFLQLRNGSQIQMEVFTTASGLWKVRRIGNAGAEASASVVVPVEVATWMELVVDFATGPTGEYWLYIADQLALHESGVVTAVGAAQADNVRFGIPAGVSGIVYHFDDVALQCGTAEEVDRLLDSQMTVLPTSADFQNTNFAPSTGSDLYPLVADASDATYVSADTAGDQFACDLADETVMNYVHWVQHDLRVLEEAAASRQVKSHLMQGAAHGYGPAFPCSTSPAWKRTTHLTDPTDAAAWSIAKVNSLKAGAYIES
ncbi:MAG: hypothetical protein CMLOHMNK_02033 [Steroidobacteraceae bacterium]|nr:hypothetical protein [Steroidobacteraceae bacterium]